MVPGCTRKLSRELWFQRRPPLRSPTGECRGSGVPWEAGREGYNLVHPEKAGWRYGFVAVTREGKSVYGEMGNNTKGVVKVYCSQGCTVGLLVVGCHGGPYGTLDESHIRGKRCTMAL